MDQTTAVIGDYTTFIDTILAQVATTDRRINPEIAYSLGRYAVKFHRLNFPTVLFFQQRLGITEVK